MGVYHRDSPFYWMLLERPGQKPLRASTGIPVDAPDTLGRKLQRQRAEDIYRARMADLARARYDLPPEEAACIGFKTYALWYRTHVLARRRGGDRDGYAMTRLETFFGTADIATITRQRVQEYITHRVETVKPSTVNREVDVLKGMLRDAVPQYLKASPLAGTKKLRVVATPKHILEPDEERRLLAALAPVDRALYIVAVDTLMRLSNVLNLRRADNKGTHLELRDSKTGPYTVPLSDRARRALGGLKGSGEYYFAHRRVAKNTRDWRGGIRLMLKAACKRAKIRYGRGIGITFHTGTRATGATRMLRAQVDPKTVQRVGNWKDPRAMDLYLHSSPALMRAAVNTIAPSESRGKPKRPR